MKPNNVRLCLPSRCYPLDGQLFNAFGVGYSADWEKIEDDVTIITIKHKTLGYVAKYPKRQNY